MKIKTKKQDEIICKSIMLLTLVLMIFVSNISITYAQQIAKRHNEEIRPEYIVFEPVEIIKLSQLYNLTSTILEEYGDEIDPELAVKLQEIREDINDHNISELSRDLSGLRRLIMENSELYATKPNELKALLSILASYKGMGGFYQGTINYFEPYILVDPNKAIDVARLLNASLTNLNDIEVINNLLRLASLLKDTDPELSRLLGETANALMKGDYTTASELYSKAYIQLENALMRLLREGRISWSELSEILEHLPTTITSDGKILKMTSDILETLLRIESKEQKPVSSSTPPSMGESKGTELLNLGKVSSVLKIGLPTPKTVGFIPYMDPLTLALIIILLTAIPLILKFKPLRNTIGRAVSSIRARISLKRIEKKVGENLHPVIRYYLMALEVMRRRGIPRLKHETPREYLAKLTGRVEYRYLRPLTYTFEKVKFGNKPIGEDEVKECEKDYSELLRGGQSR